MAIRVRDTSRRRVVIVRPDEPDIEVIVRTSDGSKLEFDEATGYSWSQFIETLAGPDGKTRG